SIEWPWRRGYRIWPRWARGARRAARRAAQLWTWTGRWKPTPHCTTLTATCTCRMSDVIRVLLVDDQRISAVSNQPSAISTQPHQPLANQQALPTADGLEVLEISSIFRREISVGLRAPVSVSNRTVVRRVQVLHLAVNGTRNSPAGTATQLRNARQRTQF